VHFYGKVKKNASSIKNGRATPKRYMNILLLHMILMSEKMTSQTITEEFIIYVLFETT
jgi:hypothetical protein